MRPARAQAPPVQPLAAATSDIAAVTFYNSRLYIGRFSVGGITARDVVVAGKQYYYIITSSFGSRQMV